MLRIGICDDEEIHRILLEENIQMYAMTENIEYSLKKFATSKELLSSNFNYDILFLDIKLEDNINGIEVGKKLRLKGYNSLIILVTSLEKFASEGYKADVFRYIIKPINQKELSEAISASISKLDKNKNKIRIKSNEASYFININDIILVESYQRKRIIYTVEKILETWESLNSLYNKLPADVFISPQKSYLINLDYVQYEYKSKIEMSNGKSINVARNRKKAVVEALHNYLGERI